MPGGERKNADHALMLALACGSTVEGAARKAGVIETTVYRRLNDPGFQRELNKLRSDMVQRATGMLTAATREAPFASRFSAPPTAARHAVGKGRGVEAASKSSSPAAVAAGECYTICYTFLRT